MSDLTSSEDNLSLDSRYSTIKLAESKIVDPLYGIIRFQAFVRGALIRDNLAAIQRGLIYEKESRIQKKEELKDGLSSSSSKTIKVTKKIRKVQPRSSVDQEDVDALDEAKFYADNPRIVDLISRHAQKVVENALPQTKKYYSSYNMSKASIDQYVVAPWAESWLLKFKSQQNDLTDQQYRYCGEMFKADLKKCIRDGYKKGCKTEIE